MYEFCWSDLPEAVDTCTPINHPVYQSRGWQYPSAREDAGSRTSLRSQVARVGLSPSQVLYAIPHRKGREDVPQKSRQCKFNFAIAILLLQNQEGQVQWCLPVTLVTGYWRQKNWEFQAIFSYLVSSRTSWTTGIPITK